MTYAKLANYRMRELSNLEIFNDNAVISPSHLALSIDFLSQSLID